MEGADALEGQLLAVQEARILTVSEIPLLPEGTARGLSEVTEISGNAREVGLDLELLAYWEVQTRERLPQPREQGALGSP